MKLSLIQKIAIPFVCLAVVISIAFGSVYWITERQLLALVDTREQLKQTESDINQLAADIQSGILSSDESYFISVAKNSINVESRIARLERIEPEIMQGLLNQYHEFFSGMVAVSSVFLEQRYDEGQARLIELVQLRESIGDTVERATEALNERYRAILQFLNQVMLMAIILMLFVLAGVLWFIKLIMKPIYQMRSMMQHIASGAGDLTQRLEINSRDEIGDIANAFNKMMSSLRELIRDVQQACTQIAAAAEQQTQVSKQTVEYASLQRSQAEQAAVAVHEMAATSQDVSGNTQLAADAARNGQETVDAGRQLVLKEMDSIRNLADQIEHAASVIRELDGQSQQIGGVLQVIRDIADQTNLLALNAAIEAARAGDLGRGFAVVADEVRNLANRTQLATVDIEKTVDILQKGASDAVAVMALQQDEAHKDAKMAEKVIAALDGIQQAIQQITDMNIQVSSAAEEQTAVAEEIDHNVSKINEGIHEIATGSTQVAEASESLAILAENLDVKVRQFKTE